MKQLRYLLTLLIFPLLAAGCAGGEGDVPGTSQDPALIMFYTDN